MSSSIRSYIRMILMEADPSPVVRADVTTGEWWDNQGKPYTGALKDSSYYMSGDQKPGSVTYPGDPFTYEETEDGKLRVVSGPNRKSIGAVIPKPVRPKIVKAEEEKKSRPEAQEKAKSSPEEAAKTSIDDIIMIISKNARLMSFYLVKSLTFTEELKNTCLEKSPEQLMPTIDSVERYVGSNNSGYKKIIQELSKIAKSEIPDISIMNITEPEDIIQGVESLKTGSSDNLSISYRKAFSCLNAIKRGVKALGKRGDFSWSKVSRETQVYFNDTLTDTLPDQERFLNLEAVSAFMSMNVGKVGTSYVRVLFGSGVRREELTIDGQHYRMSDLRKDLNQSIAVVSGSPVPN